MGVLVLIALVLIVYLLVHHSNTSRHQRPTPTADAQLTARNAEWSAFIAGYRDNVATKAEKALIEKMLADIAAQGLPIPAASTLYTPKTHHATAVTAQPAVVSPVIPEVVDMTSLPVSPHRNPQIDNITLLLYFGAFLFVASVGLFVAFAQAPGWLRTLAVLIVTMTLYISGIWLFRNKSKLKLAGLAFAGIGIAIAPLVGLAAYNYLWTGQPASVWLFTSILCLVLYGHALFALRRPLVNYIFLFTFLSLFESGVSITTAPVYYFGWAMALVGMLLQIASSVKGFWPELQESSRNSSQIFLPLAIVISLVLVPTQGVGQLGVSLLLAAIFYGLEARLTAGTRRQGNALVAQASFLASVVCIVFAMTHTWESTGTALLICNMAQLLSLGFFKGVNQLLRNYASVLMLAAGVDIALMANHPWAVLLTTGVLMGISLAVWLRQKRAEAYGVAAIAWTALPLILGQYVMNPRLAIGRQAGLLFLTLLVQLAVFLACKPKKAPAEWLQTAEATYIFQALSVLIAAILAQSFLTIGLGAVTALTMVVLAEYDRMREWSVVAGLSASVAMLNFSTHPTLFLLATLTALIFNIGLSLRYRHELNRWISAILWFILPIALAMLPSLRPHWHAATYALAYVLVMIGLIISRAIARGVIFVSNRIPLTSYMGSTSLSYVFGYTAAALVALIVAVSSVPSPLQATLVLLAIAIAIYILSVKVEKRAEISSLLPLLVQVMVWTMLRPALSNGRLIGYLVVSSLVAAGSYGISSLLQSASETSKVYAPHIKITSLAALFITPTAFLFVGHTVWPMPFGLLLASFFIYHYVKNSNQENRELAGGLLVLAVMWLMWLAGVRALQAYTHIIAALFAVYAYWRAIRGETKQSDNYLTVMLAAATIPLALQALGGGAGGLYGWWLLLEDIAFMLLGMTIRKRFVTFWGLYVAIGAVLYQLRNLGWAALTVLALFLIGLAVYQLQRYNQTEHK